MGCTQSSSKATPYGSATDSTTKPSAGGGPPNKYDDPRRLILSASSWTKTQHHDGLVADRYKVLDELGRGGFGAVSLVERLNDGVTLACKSCTTLDEKSRERLLMEAELWETVSSPYHSAVLQLVEVLKAPDGLHLITELMPFGELYDALDHIVFSEQACRMVSVQVASALAHLHLRHRVAHCDVKPPNILCRNKDPTVPGSLKLSDYGFCQRFEQRSRPSFTVSCGTLDYFAPELASNLRNARQRTGVVVKFGAGVDCWALGAMVYELLHGEPPFFAPKDDELQLDLIERHDLQFPDESFGQISSHGKAFIQGLLEADVGRRFYIEDALKHQWLQPVTDEKMKEDLSKAVSDATIERRRFRVSEKARRRLRVSVQKVIALRRLSDGNLDHDKIREALHASRREGEEIGGTPAAIANEALTSEALAALDTSETPPKRRGSETSTISYKSDDMAPRNI